MTTKVFITDGFTRRALAVCRSLGRAGFEVTCGEKSRLTPTAFSRYCRRAVVYPSPRDCPAAFMDWLVDYLRREPHDILIPMEHDVTVLLASHEQLLRPLCCLPFPEKNKMSVFLDKWETLKLAAELGIPHPRSVLPSTPERVVQETAHLQSPLVIKPRLSCAARGIFYVQGPHDLAEAYSKVHARFPFPIVQEAISQGEKLDVGCLLDYDSRLMAAFVQKELRGYPLRDGPSTAQESVWRPDLVEMSVALLQKAAWWGIAEIDYVVDPRTESPMLLEVNPRFWASIQLSIACGVNFPVLLCHLINGERMTPVNSYPVGRICRALLPLDILHFLTNPQRFHMAPGFFDFSDRRIDYDLISLQDPGPILGFFLAAARHVFDREEWRHTLHIGECKDLTR
jgi:predicted ATP-grasp superfamily ATP-dependent carboligase